MNGPFGEVLPAGRCYLRSAQSKEQFPSGATERKPRAASIHFINFFVPFSIEARSFRITAKRAHFIAMESKNEFGRQLDLPLCAGRVCHRPEVLLIAEVGIWRPEDGMVQEVEPLYSSLDVALFAKWKLANEPGIQIPITLRAQRIPS
jgi:hypothetical protein